MEILIIVLRVGLLIAPTVVIVGYLFFNYTTIGISIKWKFYRKRSFKKKRKTEIPDYKKYLNHRYDTSSLKDFFEKNEEIEKKESRQ